MAILKMGFHPDSLARQLDGKRVGVVLSAGFFGFFGHAGFLKALEQAGIVPSCLGGTSAGALVAAMSAAGMSADQIGQRIGKVAKKDFWDPDPLGIVREGLKGLGATGLLRGERFRKLLVDTLPVQTFEQCRTPLLVVAMNLSRGAAQAFTRGELAPRVHASCAYPGLFRAATIDGEHFWDGGLVDKAPAVGLHEAFVPEAIIVHYLPSRADAVPRGPLAYAKAIASAMASLRRDHFDLQVELLRRTGVPIAVITSELPELGPSKLARGPEVLEEARRLSFLALTNAMADMEKLPKTAR